MRCHVLDLGLSSPVKLVLLEMGNGRSATVFMGGSSHGSTSRCHSFTVHGNEQSCEDAVV